MAHIRSLSRNRATGRRCSRLFPSLSGIDVVRAHEGFEVGAVDVDFTTDLREGDDALIAVVLPRLG